MTLNKNFFKIIFAFVKAPIWLAILLTIIGAVFSLIVDMNVLPNLEILLLIAMFTLIVSYINLIIFGVPGYFIFKRYNLFYSKIPLYFSFIIGFIEGFIFTSGGPGSSIMFSLIFGLIFAICSLIIGYFLLKDLKKINEQKIID